MILISHTYNAPHSIYIWYLNVPKFKPFIASWIIRPSHTSTMSRTIDNITIKFWPLHCVTIQTSLHLHDKMNGTKISRCFSANFKGWFIIIDLVPASSLLDLQLKQGYWYSKRKEAENSTVNLLSNSLQIRRKQDYYSFLHYCQPKEHKTHRSIGFAKACTIFCSRSSSSIHVPLCCLIISLSLCRLSSTFKSFCFRYNRLSAVSFA